MTRTLLVVAAPALAGAGLWLATRPDRRPGPESEGARGTPRTEVVAPRRGPSPTPLTGPDLDRALAAQRELYAPRAAIDEAATQALKAERAAAAAAAAIGAAPASSIAEVLDRWHKAEERERLLLIDGVEGIASAEGVDALKSMYRECGARRICDEALAGLGASEGPGDTELLVEVLDGEDARIEADAALATVATSEKVEARVRVFAEKERERGGGQFNGEGVSPAVRRPGGAPKVPEHRRPRRRAGPPRRCRGPRAPRTPAARATAPRPPR